MNKLIETIKKLWKNPVVKTVVMGAAGATGGILATGTLVLNAKTIAASVVGAGLTLWGLFVQHPTKQDPKKVEK